MTNIKHRTTKGPLPLFFLDLEPNADNKLIYNINYLQNTKIAIEPPRKKTMKYLNAPGANHTMIQNHTVLNHIDVSNAVDNMTQQNVPNQKPPPPSVLTAKLLKKDKFRELRKEGSILYVSLIDPF